MGGIRPLPPENRPTGIFKEEVVMPAWLAREGLTGDAQADRRVHGGPEKALHQYPVAHYARLAARFPGAATDLKPGSMGENLSVAGWDETGICIGDRFCLGDAVIEVSQPRSPCWKIDERYGTLGMARFIEEEGLTGWYFRIIEEGCVEPGCDFTRIANPAPKLSIARLLELWKAHRPSPEQLDDIASTSRLSSNWIRKLRERAAHLRAMTTGAPDSCT